MCQEISIGQASGASWLGECAGKYFVAKGMADYLNAETLTFGNAMRHDNNQDGHGTYFNTEDEAEACLARYWEKQQESESQFLYTESNLAKCLMPDQDALQFKQTAELREFTDAISPFVIRVWVNESGRVLIDGFRCKTDTNNDGDCHLCAKSGGCSVVKNGKQSDLLRESPKRELKPIAYECDGSIEIRWLWFANSEDHSWGICKGSSIDDEYWNGDLWTWDDPKRFATPEEAYAEWETKIKEKE